MNYLPNITKGYDSGKRHLRLFLNLMYLYDINFCLIILGLPTKGSYILFAIINIFIFGYTLCKFRFSDRNTSVIGTILFLFLAFFVVRIVFGRQGTDYTTNSFLRLIYHPYGIMCYLVPFLLGPLARVENVSIILDFVYKQVITYIILLFFFTSFYFWGAFDYIQFVFQYETLHMFIGGGLIFLPFFLDHFNKKQKLLIIFAILVSALLSAIFARRSVLLTYLCIIPALIFVNYRTKQSVKSKSTFLIKVSLLLGIMAAFIYGNYEILFPTLSERALDDTRSSVELEVLYYLEHDDAMWSGLGLNSVYYSDFLDETRDFVETGYLNMILKGGILFLSLFVLIILPMILKGFVCRSNRFAIISSMYALLFIVAFSGSSTSMTFSIRYVFLWFLIRCYYKKRKMIHERAFLQYPSV